MVNPNKVTVSIAVPFKPEQLLALLVILTGWSGIVLYFLGSAFREEEISAWGGKLGLFPLAALHYHPSHKPVHLLTPCRDDRNFTNRQLPGVPEFVVSGESFDPRQISDRQRLVALFCHRCGVTLGASGDLFS